MINTIITKTPPTAKDTTILIPNIFKVFDTFLISYQVDS